MNLFPPQGIVATVADSVDAGTSDPPGYAGRLVVRTDTNLLRFFSSGAWRSASGVVVGDANTWTALQTFSSGIDVKTSIVLRQTTANYTVQWNDPAAARTLTVPDTLANDTFAFLAATQTLTNKTVSGGTFSGTIAGTPTFSGTIAFTATSPFTVANSQTLTISVASQTVGAATLTIPNFANVNDTFAFITLAQTLSNKTISGGTFSGTIAGTPTFSGTIAFTATSPFTVANSQTLTISVASQTVGAATLTIPNFANVNDTFAFITLAQTLSNKTISGGTFSGTIAGAHTLSGLVTFTGSTRAVSIASGSTLDWNNDVGFGRATTGGAQSGIVATTQTANTRMDFGIRPTGTSVVATFNLHRVSSSTDDEILQLSSDSQAVTQFEVRVIQTGAGSFRPLVFYNNNVLAFRVTTAPALEMGSNIIPDSNKARSVGLTGTRFLDVFTGNAVTTGTSRTYEVEGLFCPKCGAKAKRSTGGLVMNGYNEDFCLAFCSQCRLALIDIVKHQKDFPVPPFEEARFVNVETGSHGGSSNYIFLRFKYKFGGKEYVNGTFLSEAERKIMEGADETAKKNLLEYLMQVEWESSYRTEVMGEEVKQLETSYKENHLHALLGLKIINA